MIVVSLPKGYLGKNMDLVQSIDKAEEFGTKKQAQRKLARVEKKRPEMDLSGYNFVPLTKELS